MAFVAEDGTGLETANSYVSVEYADAYFEDRGNTVWAAASDDNKEIALIKATDYLNTRFKFKGYSYNEEQALHFPISNWSSGEAEMPVGLKKATAEYALRALSAVLAPDPDTDSTGGRIIEKSEKLGPIEESVKYSEATPIQIFKPYPSADLLLRGLVSNSNGGTIR